MDKKFYIDDFEFERYLKEKADDFKMYPSKRVWNSIYNNMHPGSRWPSISMCIILIGTLFLVGFLNTNSTESSRAGVKQTSATSSIYIASASSSADKNSIEFSTKDISGSSSNALNTGTSSTSLNNGQNTSSNISSKNSDRSRTANTPLASIKSISVENKIGFANVQREVRDQNAESSQSKRFNTSINSVAGIDGSSSQKQNEFSNINNNISINDIEPAAQPAIFIEKNDFYESVEKKASVATLIAAPTATIAVPNKETVKSNTSSNKLSEADKFWIENYAMYNRPAPKKWKGKLSWQLYLTPSLIYRTLDNAALNRFGNTNVSDVDNAVTQKPSIGLELGTGLQYDLTKRLKFKTGFQLNYTRYNSIAYDNGHPIATSITMLSGETGVYTLSRISPYNSTYGLSAVKLHNQTFQVSLPIGAAYKIAEIDNVSWFAGASIQPTFVWGGKSYLISSDRRNYIEETDMLNKFNLNAGFETYLSIKTGNVNWQVGPQFRKQLFSTNSKEYSIQERLQSYGVKIGIIKKL